MRYIAILAAIFLNALIAVQGNAQPNQDASALQEQSAKLYVFNDSAWTLIPSDQEITDNGKPFVRIPRQTYKLVSISPGMHILRPEPALWKQEVSFAAESGRTYYVVIAYKPERSWALPFAGPPLLLKALDEQEAAELIREMRPN